MKTINQWVRLAVLTSARHQAPTQDGSEIIFHLCWQVNAVVGFIVIGCGFLFVTLFRTASIPGDPFYVRLVVLLMLAALPLSVLFLLPGKISVDSTGVRQHCWWGKERRISWNDFATAIHDPQDGSTIVYGKFSSPIRFSPYLVGHARFDREMKNWSQAENIPDNI
jgi:hypothetical protein